MARTMSDKAYETYIKRNVSKAMDRESWRLHGGYFYQTEEVAANGLYVKVEWRWTFKGLTATIDPYAVYGQEERREFIGGDALEECVNWVTERIIARANAVRERTKPYEEAMVMYRRALIGDLPQVSSEDSK